MDVTELRGEMAEGGPLEPLVITEEEEMIQDPSSAINVQRWSGGSAIQKAEEPPRGDENEEDVALTMCLEEHQTNTEAEEADVDVKGKLGDDEPEQAEDDGQNGGAADDPQMDVATLNLREHKPEGSQSHLEDAKQAHRLTPDFPEALYELLCTLQEGRRLNDQRCSFKLGSGMRRRCHSEPNTTKPAKRVVFSSMTSLQTEEFFDLVATAQARRLDDQRAQLERSQPPKAKGRSFRGSIRQLSFARKQEKTSPAPVPKEDLYDMILTTQAQGRLEDQRSRAPGPMDDEDFFSLLLRVQGGRMDEQRTELPGMLET